MRKLSILAFATVAGAAQASLLYDNGSFVTGVGNGFGGANTSAIETGFTLFGSNANNAPFRIADDFTVTGPGWNISDIVVRAYQTQTNGVANTTSTFTGAFLEIYNGAPNAGGTLIYGDTTTNRLSGAAFSGVYRVSTDALNSQRAIMDLSIGTAGLPTLAAGTYWISIGLTGSVASGPWMGPTVPADGSDNAIQWTGSAWQAMDGNGTAAGGNHDIPFLVNGTAVPEPGTMAAIGLGIAALAARRRRK